MPGVANPNRIVCTRGRDHPGCCDGWAYFDGYGPIRVHWDTTGYLAYILRGAP